MMKVSRKIWRSSQKSTSIYRRKKKKSNEKNNLGKSGKRSRGHKRVKTYKRVKIFHKGGAPPKIEYTANLEYKKKSLVPFFNNSKIGNFKVSISVSQSSRYTTRNTYTYAYFIAIKLETETGNETMTLEIPIGNLDDLKRTIESSEFTSGKDKYTFNFPSNHSFFEGIIEKSTRLLNEFREEQEKLDKEKELIKRIKEIRNKLPNMNVASVLVLHQSRSYKIITDTLHMMQASMEYESFKTDQKTLAENEKMSIERSTYYHDDHRVDHLEKDTRKLLVDAVLNRILRTQSLLIITSHLLSEYNLHKNEVMDVINLLQDQDPNYDLTHFPPGAISIKFNDPPYDLLDLLGDIKNKISEIQVKEEEQKREVMKMIELMKDIHIRNKHELEYGIIREEQIGSESNGVWSREWWWAPHLPDVLFIDSWIPPDQVRRPTS